MARNNPPSILVVEDERAVRDLIVAFLKSGGHQNIVVAGNAEEALFYVFKDSSLNIQLAVVDLVLPNASGLALIRKIRGAKSVKRKTTPIVVLTGRTDTDTYRAAARRGIQGYLIKPVSPSLLIETVNKVMIARGMTPPKPTGKPAEKLTLEDQPAVAGDNPFAAEFIPPPPSLDDGDNQSNS